MAGFLGLIGRWPSKISVSGNEISWSELNDTVNEQIEAARDAGEKVAVRELEDLRRRLTELQQTGTASRHPAAAYDDAVERAIREALPGASVRRATTRSREEADFEVQLGSKVLLVESKFKFDYTRAFQGSTLQVLLDRLADHERLLIVTNSTDVRGAEDMVRAYGNRVRVITWLGPGDDKRLRAALEELLHGAPLA